MFSERDEASQTPQISRGLHWRIKDSFVQYVLLGAGGEYSVGDGAEDDDQGNFFFSISDAAHDEGDWSLRFQGDVRFRGHHGALFVPVVNPVIQLGPAGGTLSLQRMKADGADDAGADRMIIAELDPAEPQRLGHALAWPTLTPRLTPEGVALLGDVYPVGEPMDALRVIIDAD